MKKMQQPKYSWYKYHLAFKKYRNIHTRIEQSIEDGSFWELAEKFQKALLRRLNILFKRLLRILQGVRLGTAAASVAFMILTGNINAQSLTQQTGSANPFNGVDVGSYSVPAFVDIDNDGDYDAYIASQVTDGEILFYENIGTNTAPVFQAPSRSAKLKAANIPPPGGISYTFSSRIVPAFVDIDGDGDFDLKVGNQSGYTENYVNSGTATSPAFGYTCQNGLWTGSIYDAAPAFVDIDNDGDFDAFVGNQFGQIIYYKNYGNNTASCFGSIWTGSANPLYGFNVSCNAKPAFVDFDDDGDFDAFVGDQIGNTTDGKIHYFKNNGTNSAPSFGTVPATENPFDGLFLGQYLAPAFVDINGDGNLDAFVGAADGTIKFFSGVNPNQAPVLASIEGTPIDYMEDAGNAPITNSITLTDADDTNMESAVVQITGNYQAGQDQLNFINQNGITGTWDPALGKLTLTGSAAVADYQAALRSVSFSNNSQSPENNLRTISITANDGDVNSNILTRDITVTGVNDAPFLLTNRVAPIDESGSVVLDNSFLSADDPEGSILSIRYYVDQGPTHGTLSSNAFTQNEINQGQISYMHNGDLSESDSFTFHLEDGEGGVSDNYTFNIAINQINTAPVLSEIESSTMQFVAGSQQTPVTGTLQVSDEDNADLVGATVAVGNYVPGEDFLVFTDGGGITHTFDAQTGMLNLTGTATVAGYQSALRSVEFLNLSGVQSLNSTRIISFVVNDGVADSEPVTRTISIEIPTGTSAGLTPPSNVTSTYNPDGTVTVTWEDNTGNEIGYIIYRQLVTEGKLSVINAYEEIGIVSANSVSFVDETAQEGVAYSYKVVAYDDNGISDGGEGTEVVQTKSLIPPSDLSAEINASEQIVLTWIDNSQIEEGYKVERDGGSGFVEIAEVETGVTTYTDETATPGVSYTYQVYAFSSTSVSESSNTATILITGIEDFDGMTPVDFVLNQNYPNPFNPTTTIRFGLPSESHVTIKVFNMLGQEIASLVNNVMSGGYHEVQFDATKLTSGIYVYKIQAGNFVQIKKMILMK